MMKFLTKPRYSLLGMVVIMACFVIIYGFNAYSNRLKTKKYDRHIFKITQSPLPNIRIPVTASNQAQFYKKPYKFSVDWFTKNIPLWESVLERYRDKPINYLEIGIFEGRSLLWLLENVLTHEDSRATAIDVFSGEDYERTYYTNLNLSGHAKKVTTIKGFSQLEMRKLSLGSFDIIYIDGSHFKCDVLEDAVLASRLVKPGGLIIFDDYGYGRHVGHWKDIHVREAASAFALCFDEKFDVIHNGFQLIIQKKALMNIYGDKDCGISNTQIQ